MTDTPNLGLYKPTIGETGWGTLVNGNFDTLDIAAGSVTNVLDPQYAGGADPSGSADSTPAFQAALAAAAGGKVLVPAGSYKITETLTLTKGTVLEGVGYASQLKNYTTSDDPLIYITYYNHQCTIHNLRITRGNTGATGHVIFIDGDQGLNDGSHYALRTVIDRVVFDGGGDATHWAIYTRWALETYIQHCTFGGVAGGGIALTTTSNASVVRDCCMSNGGNGAIGGMLLESAGLLVEGCVIEAWRGQYGVSGGAILVRDWFEDNWGDDIVANASGGFTVFGCNIQDTMSGNYPYAVHLDATQGDTGMTLRDTGSGSGEFKISQANGHAAYLFYDNCDTGGPGHGGEINLDDVEDMSKVGILRLGGNHDKIAVTGGPIAYFECVGNTAIRLEESAKIYFGTHADTATVGDTNLYRSAANTLKTDDSFVVGGRLSFGASKSAIWLAPYWGYDLTNTNPNWTGPNVTAADVVKHGFSSSPAYIDPPVGGQTGQHIMFDLANETNNPITINFDVIYKLSAAFGPANGKRACIGFYNDGANWIETSRSGDVT